jgi:hypothetical protein
MPATSIPCRRATSAWPSSWTTIEPNSSSALTTAVRYAVVSELSSASRNASESQKMTRNRTRNQLKSTPMRIPKTLASWIEPGLPNMVEW